MTTQTRVPDGSEHAQRVSPLAGKAPDPAMLVSIPRLVAAYYTERPDPATPEHRVRFGTSGHRGSSLTGSFNEWHVLAITQSICRYRSLKHIDGPLFLGIDTHALSEPASRTALEVLTANGVTVCIAVNDEYTPTPAVSHAILTFNRGRKSGLADGIVITPSTTRPTTAASSKPAAWGTGRPGGHLFHRARGQRTPRRWSHGSEAHALRKGAASIHDTPLRLSELVRRGPRVRGGSRWSCQRGADAGG